MFCRYMLTQPDRFDVALLHLDRPVFYQDNIIPICLPLRDILLTGKIGMVAGWGKTDNSFRKTRTNILHKVLVPIIKNEQCINWHEEKNILVQVEKIIPDAIISVGKPIISILIKCMLCNKSTSVRTAKVETSTKTNNPAMIKQ